MRRAARLLVGATATVGARGAAGGAVVCAVLAGCSGGGPSPSPTPAFFTGRATAYVIGLDQLKVADFAATEKAHSVDAATAAAGDSTLALALGRAGMLDAAHAEYFRTVPELSTANGPLDVDSTVMRFSSARGAHAAFLAEVAHTDAVAGMQPQSAGVLGDEAHGDVLATATGPDGTPLVEATVVWRNGNLVEVLVVRGRRGGTGLDDALLLAHAVTSGQR